MSESMAQNKLGPRPVTQYSKDYFVYGVDFGVVAAGASANGNIQIQADSDFLWRLSTYYVFINGAANQTESSRVIPAMTVQITDSGSGRQLFNQALPVSALFGTGELPYPVDPNRIFKARSNISFAVNNISAVAYRLFLALHGEKIFQM